MGYLRQDLLEGLLLVLEGALPLKLMLFERLRSDRVNRGLRLFRFRNLLEDPRLFHPLQLLQNVDQHLLLLFLLLPLLNLP